MSSPSTSCALDPIPTWLLKKVLAVLLEPLTRIVNLSLSSGRFLSAWKNAIISPLLKKPSLDPKILLNYRPIAFLPFSGKLIERSVAIQLNYHLATNSVLSDYQSAYRIGHSIETLLISLLNDLLLAADEGDGTALLFLDLSAAFDTVDHGILLRRLSQHCGVTGVSLDWFKSYLSGRSHRVSIDGTLSSAVALLWGVIQGSVLGAILYVVYVNPLAAIALLFGISIHQFSDDTQLRIRFRLIEQLLATKTMSNCVSALLDWFFRNRVKTNVPKTELLYTSSSTRRNGPEPTPMTVAGATVPPSAAVKTLGVTLDEHLSMEQHVNNVCKAAYYHLHLISKIRRYLTFAAAKSLVISTILSRLDFANGILIGLPLTQIQKLQRVQNAAARVVARCDRRASVTPILRRLHWLPVQRRIEFKVLTFAHKCVHGTAPAYLSSLVSLRAPLRTGLRSSSTSSLDLSVPAALTARYGERAFSRIAPKLWNALPWSVKSTVEAKNFRARLKNHLFRTSFLST